MRRTILIAALFFAMMSSVGTVCGQAAFNVNFDSLNFIQPSTVGLGDTVTYDVTVVNNTASDFFGQISWLRRVDGGPIDTIFTDQFQDTLPAFSNRPYVLTDSVLASRFGGGINVVVVWPTAPNVTTLDSAVGILNVTGVGIPERIRDGYPISVFPNPTRGSIRFQTQFSPLQVRETILMDQQGRVLHSQARLPSEMSLEGFAAGIYFIEVRLRDGAVRRFKVVKAN